MASVVLNGVTYTDDSNPATGMGNGGHRVRFIPSLSNFLIEADGSMNSSLYRPLYEAGADLVILGPPALWNKDTDFNKAWDIMESELERELDGAERKI